jgi:hypothetical protein
MNALKKIAHARHSFGRWQVLRTAKELAQVCACAEAFGARARNNQGLRVALQFLERRDELLELGKRPRADFIAGRMVEHQLDYAVGRPPRECGSPEALHALFFW